ncbi:MAG: alpha/beta hydrolase-fold protein [Agriterribacter sp.]
MLNKTIIPVESYTISSLFLERDVVIDFFMPPLQNENEATSLLLINDGQNMEELGLAGMLTEMYAQAEITPLCCVGIHCGEDRKNEYGTALIKDFKGRGAKAGVYTRFIFEELMPFIRNKTGIASFKTKSFAGFSLGGLSAIDIVWNNPQEFERVGVFSGSLWWRTKALDDGYVEERDRIMHAQVRDGRYAPWLKFFFETGTMDETEDRNNNGIIDSIDDTLGLIDELKNKGYSFPGDITYLELKEGRHDIQTWAQAMPPFLKWGWGMQQ